MRSRRRMVLISSGLSTRTVVRQASSNSRIVCLSIAPTSCSASMVSWIAADTSLRYLFVISFNLLNLAVCDQDVQLGFGKPQDILGHLLELLFLVLADVVSIAFRKSVEDIKKVLGVGGH